MRSGMIRKKKKKNTALAQLGKELNDTKTYLDMFTKRKKNKTPQVHFYWTKTLHFKGAVFRIWLD